MILATNNHDTKKPAKVQIIRNFLFFLNPYKPFSIPMRLEDEIKTQKFQSQTHKAFLNVLLTASVLRAQVNAVIKPHGISHEQYNVLRILRGQKQEPICMSEISSRMLDKNSNVTRIMEKLIDKQLVIKYKSLCDHREVVAEISLLGLELLAKIDIEFELHQVHHSPLSEKEAERLNFLLEKMRNF